MIAAHRRAPAIDLAQRIGFWAENFSPTTTRLARINASVRDFLGCVIAGTRRPELRPALWLANGGCVPVWGLADSFDPAGAALVTGTAGSLLQLNDFYAPGASHPSSPVIAAAWSALHADGGRRSDHFLRAVAAGYEVANRIAGACVPAQMLSGSTPTATAGALGAAVAAGLIRGLDGAGIGRAIANAALLLPLAPIAAMRAHGELVPLHGGLAARAGYEAASVAREAHAGIGILEGDDRVPGLIGLLGGDPADMAPESWRGETIDAIGWKFFPACLATHVALEAALRMGRVDASLLTRVIVRQPKGLLDGIVASGPREAGLYDRLMSLRWVLARALETNRYDYPDALVDSNHTTDFAQRIDIVHDSSLDEFLPERLCVTLELHSGSDVRRIAYQRPACADPEGPGPRGWTTTLDELRLRKKFDSLVAAAAPLTWSLGQLGIG